MKYSANNSPFSQYQFNQSSTLSTWDANEPDQVFFRFTASVLKYHHSLIWIQFHFSISQISIPTTLPSPLALSLHLWVSWATHHLWSKESETRRRRLCKSLFSRLRSAHAFAHCQSAADETTMEVCAITRDRVTEECSQKRQKLSEPPPPQQLANNNEWPNIVHETGKVRTKSTLFLL